MTDFFPTALAYVLNNEGGFVDDIADAGGATNMGITIETLSSWLGRLATAEEVKHLTHDMASDIYRARYWTQLNCAWILQPAIATAIFDAGVLFGGAVSALYAQKAAKECGCLTLNLDGHIGHTTAEALNGLRAASWLSEFRTLLLERIAQVIERNPHNTKFKAGWENRVNRYILLA